MLFSLQALLFILLYLSQALLHLLPASFRLFQIAFICLGRAFGEAVQDVDRVLDSSQIDLPVPFVLVRVL